MIHFHFWIISALKEAVVSFTILTRGGMHDSGEISTKVTLVTVPAFNSNLNDAVVCVAQQEATMLNSQMTDVLSSSHIKDLLKTSLKGTDRKVHLFG